MPGESASHEVEAFLDAGEPPVVFTLGSSAVHVAGNFYEAAAGACRILGRRGLLLTGSGIAAPRNLPPGVAAFPAAPHSLVMPRACATVHHGGVGTTAQALRAGRPTVVVPFAHDQFDNAARVQRLAVGGTVARSRLTAASLARVLQTLLDDPETLRRASDLGNAISSEDGAAHAADALESVMRVGETPREPIAAATGNRR
jgi:UDP:flavonoid glycosyltransferase YjiC (YdhE family)